jgi:hypothetical protein
MKSILKLAVLLFVMYWVFGIAAFIFKKAIFWVIVVGVGLLIYRYLNGDSTKETSEAQEG